MKKCTSLHWILLGTILGCSSPRTSGSAGVPQLPRARPLLSSQVAESEPGLALEVWASVHGSVEGPLRNGMELLSGDSIALTARVSSAAQIYLVYCDAQRRLVSYPANGGSAIAAEHRQSLPDGNQSFVLDDIAGNEVIYVVAAQRPLTTSDPILDAVLSRARLPDKNTDCDPALDGVLAGTEHAPFSDNSAGGTPSHGKASMVASRPVTRSKKPELTQPVPWTVRGIDIVSADSLRAARAGSDGIVILRYGFVHRAQRDPNETHNGAAGRRW